MEITRAAKMCDDGYADVVRAAFRCDDSYVEVVCAVYVSVDGYAEVVRADWTHFKTGNLGGPAYSSHTLIPCPKSNKSYMTGMS